MADFLGIDRRINKENPLYLELKKGNIPSPKFRTCQLLGIQGDYHYTSMYDKSKYLYLLEAPFRISNKCCNVMKKNSARQYEKSEHRVPFIGTMATESRLRQSKWMKYGCNAFEQRNHPTSQPLSFWTEQDILHYIKQYGLDIAETYGDIAYVDEQGFFYENSLVEDMKLTTTKAKRTGCVFCMFGIGQDPERFLRLKADEPKKYEYVMRGGKFDEDGMWIPYNGLGYKFVIDWLNEHGDMRIKY